MAQKRRIRSTRSSSINQRRCLDPWTALTEAAAVASLDTLTAEGPLDPLNPLAISLGASIGLVLGLLGGGGSILALPCFLYVFREPPEVAVAESLAVVAIGAATAFLFKIQPFISKTTSNDGGDDERRVDLSVAAPFAVIAGASSFATTRVASAVPNAVRLSLFGCFAVASALSMWASVAPSSGSVSSSPPLDESSSSVEGKPGRLAALAVGVGALTALIGAGGGFVVVPALTVAGNVPIKKAVDSALLVVFTNAAVAFAGFEIGGTVDIHFGIVVPFSVAVGIGAICGSIASNRTDGPFVKRAFSIFVLLLAAAAVCSSLVHAQVP